MIWPENRRAIQLRGEQNKMDGIKLRIADLRKRDGLTQQELAEQLGVTYQSVSKWENGVSQS